MTPAPEPQDGRDGRRQETIDFSNPQKAKYTGESLREFFAAPHPVQLAAVPRCNALGRDLNWAALLAASLLPGAPLPRLLRLGTALATLPTATAGKRKKPYYAYFSPEQGCGVYSCWDQCAKWCVGTSCNFNRGCSTYEEACEAAAHAAGHAGLCPAVTVDAPPAHVEWPAVSSTAEADQSPPAADFFGAAAIADAIAGVASGAGPSSFAPTLPTGGATAMDASPPGMAAALPCCPGPSSSTPADAPLSPHPVATPHPLQSLVERGSRSLPDPRWDPGQTQEPMGPLNGRAH